VTIADEGDIRAEGEALFLASIRERRGNESVEEVDAVWHSALTAASVPVIIFALGRMGATGTIGAKLHGRIQAARAMVDHKLTARAVRTMKRLEKTSTNVARQGVWVAVISVLVTIAATYLGVRFALWGQANLEASRERQQAVRVARAAGAEADRSLAVLAKRPSLDEWHSASGQKFQLLLRNPVSSLSTLSQMPAFLSLCEPAGVSELLNLNVTLAWVPLPEFFTTVAVPTEIAQRESVPDPTAVLSGVKRASELLGECLKSLKGVE
jgi:hypothetical protein